MEFKTEEEILLSLIADAEQKGLLGDTTEIVEKVSNGENTENQYVLDLATHAYILYDFTRQLEDVYNGCDIATATGSQLDTLGHLVNVNRFPGQAAMIQLQLSLTVPNTRDIVIPEGTVVIIDQLQVDPYLTYTIDSTVTIPAGSTEAEATCSSDLYALQRKVPIECVYGLEGFPDVTVTNREAGTSGRNIENDDEYRQRILLWNVKNQTGTRAAFEAYLGEYKGLDDYKLIPQPEGVVGNLTVVCDCAESMLSQIQNDLQENCMIFTDDPCYCINPAQTVLDVSITAMITREPIQHTVSEIIEMIRHEIEVYIDGGETRSGQSIHGLRIGDSFIPSQLVMHIHNAFPELVSVSIDTEETTADDAEKFKSGFIEVEIT